MKEAIFNGDLKREFPESPLGELENYGSEYEKRFYREIEYVERDPKLLLGHNGIKYLLHNMQRSRFLYRGYIDTINSRNPIPAFLIARGHLETTGAVVYLFDKLNRYYKKEISFEEVEGILHKLLLGYKSETDKKRNPLIPDAINAITLVESIDKVIAMEAKDTDERTKYLSNRPVWKFYEALSESCHPNFEGILSGAEVEGPKTIYNEEPTLNRLDMTSALAMELSLKLYFNFYDKGLQLLREHECLPEMIKQEI